MDANAHLMKEVVDREWQGRSSGFSFRIAKGVRYRVGSRAGTWSFSAVISPLRTLAS